MLPPGLQTASSSDSGLRLASAHRNCTRGAPWDSKNLLPPNISFTVMATFVPDLNLINKLNNQLRNGVVLTRKVVSLVLSNIRIIRYKKSNFNSNSKTYPNILYKFLLIDVNIRSLALNHCKYPVYNFTLY